MPPPEPPGLGEPGPALRPPPVLDIVEKLELEPLVPSEPRPAPLAPPAPTVIGKDVPPATVKLEQDLTPPAPAPPVALSPAPAPPPPPATTKYSTNLVPG